ncbi:hypothetical protein CRV00_13990, partial [Malaciobacter molluscorum]|uniref:leucine-rich repeat domain-containing protein n=1 Tax=Malaciobacter molluscorum TaxID=1032072 RepID=UPI0010270E36
MENLNYKLLKKMTKIFILFILLTNILFAKGLANKKEFMKMCNNPTPSQKITFEALAKDNRVKIDQQMCDYLYIQTDTSGFSSANADTNNITDLSPLQFFLDLESIRLYDNKVKDISVLKHLTKLKELNLSGNPVSDLSALKDLKYLEDLDLYSTQVSDLSPINSIKTLQILSYGYMDNIDTIDISQIKDLRNLEYLGLGRLKIKNFHLINNFTNLTNFSPPRTITEENMNLLVNLKKLERLRLSNNKHIRNIDFILNFPNMQELFLNKTNIKDISTLKKLPKLTILDISNTQVTDASGVLSNTNVDP